MTQLSDDSSATQLQTLPSTTDHDCSKILQAPWRRKRPSDGHWLLGVFWMEFTASASLFPSSHGFFILCWDSVVPKARYGGEQQVYVIDELLKFNGKENVHRIRIVLQQSCLSFQYQCLICRFSILIPFARFHRHNKEILANTLSGDQ